MTRAFDDLTTGRKMILHLSDYSRWKGCYVCPVEITQPGIADQLDNTRANVAKELIRLQRKGFVEFEKHYVKGARRMLKVYFLTPKGEILAAQLKSTLNGELFRGKPPYTAGTVAGS